MATKTIKSIKLETGETIYVEVEEINDATLDTTRLNQSDSKAPTDLPSGAEYTSTSIDDVIIGGKLLRETISGTAKTVLSGFQELQPDEWSVEINIAMKGKATIIPVLVSGEGKGSIKITATWKKGNKQG